MTQSHLRNKYSSATNTTCHRKITCSGKWQRSSSLSKISVYGRMLRAGIDILIDCAKRARRAANPLWKGGLVRAQTPQKKSAPPICGGADTLRRAGLEYEVG